MKQNFPLLQTENKNKFNKAFEYKLDIKHEAASQNNCNLLATILIPDVATALPYV